MAECIKCGTPVPDPGEGRLYMLNEECVRLRQENKDLRAEIEDLVLEITRLKDIIKEDDSGFGDTSM
jgi:hypothetical protein